MPAHPRQGHRRSDHRTVVNGIMFCTRTGSRWRDLPECYGNWKSVYGLRAGCDAQGPEWSAAADATVVRAHQHASGARHAPPKDIPAQRLAPAVLSDPARIRGAIE